MRPDASGGTLRESPNLGLGLDLRVVDLAPGAGMHPYDGSVRIYGDFNVRIYGGLYEHV